MGCGCKKAPAFSDDVTQGRIELPEYNILKEKDSLVKFEKKFPLYRLHIAVWMKKLQ